MCMYNLGSYTKLLARQVRIQSNMANILHNIKYILCAG